MTNAEFPILDDRSSKLSIIVEIAILTANSSLKTARSKLNTTH